MRQTVAIATLLLVLGSMHGCSCNDNGAGQGDGGAVDTDGGTDDAGPMVTPSGDGGCTSAGNSCATNSDCCSGMCDANHVCVGGSCAADNAPCQVATDCCKLNCSNGSCSSTQCISDNQPCSAGGTACCSTSCVNGSCQPLNTTCKTAGNACPNGNGDCCSKLCTGGVCANPTQVSYCTQPGDICFHDNECCTGICTGATATTAGTCANIATSCAVDGTVCNGCTGCCSSFCAPFGTSGSKICQPASGCHVLGDLCTKTSDCCGGDVASGLPGAGLVRCIPDPAHPSIGTCSMASPTNCTGGAPTCKNTCQPEGDVCHFLGNGGCSSNSFPNNCCGAPGNKGMCKLDALGIPRCYGIAACVMTGGNCASAADCCNGVPCLPDSTGALKCSAATCAPQNAVCTTTADCCSGLQCIVPPGSLKGTCINPNANPPPPDGGAADLAGVDLLGTPPPDLATPPPPMCSLYGQACSTTVPCCGGQGTCLTPYPLSGACPAGATNCTCYTPLM